MSGYRRYCREHKAYALRTIPESDITYYMNIIRKFAEYAGCNTQEFIEELEENLGWRYYDDKLSHRMKAEHLEFLEAISRGDIDKLDYFSKSDFGVGFYKYVNLHVAFKNKQAKSIFWLKNSTYINRPIEDYICLVEDIDFFKELEKTGIFTKKMDYSFSLELDSAVPWEFYENMKRVSYAKVYDMSNEKGNEILKNFLQEHRQEEIKNCLEFQAKKEKVDAFNKSEKEKMKKLMDIFFQSEPL